MRDPQAAAAPRYVAILLALLALTALTVSLAFVHLGGALNVVVALTIAAAKSSLVILFFMHMRHGARALWIFASAGAFLFAILLGLTLTETLSRGWPWSAS